MKTNIRPATRDDLDLLLEIAEAMHHESPRYVKLIFSHEKMLQLFLNLIYLDNYLMLVAERDDGTVIGGIGGMVTEPFFSTDKVANEIGLFLLPEYRGGTTAARLVKAYVAWAHELGAKLIQLGISTGIYMDKTAALYRALGLQQCSIGFETKGN
jgi:GNAT superfamily N-acetyltransferase